MNRRPAAKLAVASLLATLLATPASAELRRIGLTSFDRIEVVGDMTVEVRSSHSIAATAEGSRDALDTLEVRVENRTLHIRQLAYGAYGARRPDAGPVTVRVTAQNLRAVVQRGAGAVSIDGLRGPDILLFLNGAGQLTARNIAAEALTVRTTGNGTMTLAGRSRSIRAALNGGGQVDASALSADALSLTTVGAGTSRFTAARTADIQASGTGGVTVDGRPACTVRNLSSGTVRCGASPASPAG